QAVASANKGCRTRVLSLPLSGGDSFLADLESAPEGWRQWNGGGWSNRGRPSRSVLAVAWWTDFIGRKHLRAVARRGGFEDESLKNLLWPHGQPLSPLALVAPGAAFWHPREGPRSSQVLCRCGAWGAP